MKDFRNPTEGEKHNAFEWLRARALNNGSDCFHAAVMLAEVSKLNAARALSAQPGERHKGHMHLAIIDFMGGVTGLRPPADRDAIPPAIRPHVDRLMFSMWAIGRGIPPSAQEVFDNWSAYLRSVDREDFKAQLAALATSHSAAPREGEHSKAGPAANGEPAGAAPITREELAEILSDLKLMWSALVDVARAVPGAAATLATRSELPPAVDMVFDQAATAGAHRA